MRYNLSRCPITSPAVRNRSRSAATRVRVIGLPRSNLRRADPIALTLAAAVGSLRDPTDLSREAGEV